MAKKKPPLKLIKDLTREELEWFMLRRLSEAFGESDDNGTLVKLDPDWEIESSCDIVDNLCNDFHALGMIPGRKIAWPYTPNEGAS